VLVNFTNREDIENFAVPVVSTHLYMVLDVSGSMNTPEKYPLLRQAIPQLIQSLSDDDFLTIVLFSKGYDLILSEPIRAIRSKIKNILERIDHSGVMFGRII